MVSKGKRKSFIKIKKFLWGHRNRDRPMPCPTPPVVLPPHLLCVYHKPGCKRLSLRIRESFTFTRCCVDATRCVYATWSLPVAFVQHLDVCGGIATSGFGATGDCKLSTGQFRSLDIKSLFISIIKLSKRQMTYSVLFTIFLRLISTLDDPQKLSF